MENRTELMEMIMRLARQLETAGPREQYEIAEKLKALAYTYSKLFKEYEKNRAK